MYHTLDCVLCSCAQRRKDRKCTLRKKFRIIEAKMSDVGMVFDRDVSKPHIAIYDNEY